ncbi:MAG TPA: hypothetical protein VLE44_01570 [Candidatus Saccharimonadales bacterium]|nr:hypothetical protein [Candidatus Saccharimonadales bacterium]
MYSSDLIGRVIDLRKSGKTYSEIQKITKIKIPKSTLSTWTSKINYSPDYYERVKKINSLNLMQARKIASQKLKEKRSKLVKYLRDKNLGCLTAINPQVQKLLLSMIYQAEGAKYKSTSCLNLGNSSPKFIELYLYLLRNSYKIDESKFRIRIQCRADQNVQLLEKFWQKITNIGPERTYPTYIDKRTIGKPTLKKDYKGVCTVHYLNSSLHMEIELLADSVIKYLVSKGP